MTFCSFSIIHKTKQENYFYESNKQLTLFEVASISNGCSVPLMKILKDA